jgi:hypothetical protein
MILQLAYLYFDTGRHFIPQAEHYMLAVDGVYSTRPLGTPRGRCDAYSGKFSISMKPSFIESVGAKKHVEG